MCFVYKYFIAISIIQTDMTFKLNVDIIVFNKFAQL